MRENKDYAIKIVDTSRELTKKEQAMLKDTSDAVLINDMVSEGACILKPVAYVVLDIHNEKSDSKDYTKLVLIDENGEKYSTGSEAFITTFQDIWADMVDSEEEWALKCYSKKGKNQNPFLTCSIV